MAVCEPERMLHGATALGCAATKQFCCFIGPEGTVEKNLRELAVLAEKEKQQEGSEEPEAFVDNVIMYEVLSELKESPPGPAASPAPAAAAATVWRSAALPWIWYAGTAAPSCGILPPRTGTWTICAAI